MLVAGPGADARGGIGSVQYLLEEQTRDVVDLITVRTHVDGPLALRLRVMILGTARAAVLIARRRPDVVHLHLSQRLSAVRKGLLVALARARGVPTVVHVHGSGFLDWFDALPPVARRTLRWALRPDRLVVLSPGLRPEYLARLRMADDAVVALRNPVAWPATVPVRGVDPDGEVLALFLGRFGVRKGIYDLLEAVALLPADVRARFRLVAGGDGEEEQVRSDVARLGIGDVVDVAGWIDRAARDALLARAEILVLPSSHEGLPMAVLEAMAWGLVPVVTPVGGLPGVVVEGHNGVLVPVGDPTALAEALTRLVRDGAERSMLGDRARHDVAEMSTERWSKQLGELWGHVARGR